MLRMLTILTVAILAWCGPSFASTIDVQDYSNNPNLYFVDQDANKYNAPYYRWYDGDWSWTHDAIAGASTATSISLNISAFDIDWASGEIDVIYAYDNGVKTYVGTLTGLDDTWSYTTFDLTSNFFDDVEAGLQVFIDIDSTHNYNDWAVTLAKSVISVDGGSIPNPEPGATPEPGTVVLLGLGLAGVALAGRRLRKS